MLKASVCKGSMKNTETSVIPKAGEIKQFLTFSKQSILLAFSIQWQNKLFLKYISNGLQLRNNCKTKISKQNSFSTLPSNKIAVLIHGRYKLIYLNLLLGACHLKTRTFGVSIHFHSLFVFHGITRHWSMTDPLGARLIITDTEIPACVSSCCSRFLAVHFQRVNRTGNSRLLHLSGQVSGQCPLLMAVSEQPGKVD